MMARAMPPVRTFSWLSFVSMPVIRPHRQYLAFRRVARPFVLTIMVSIRHLDATKKPPIGRIIRQY